LFKLFSKTLPVVLALGVLTGLGLAAQAFESYGEDKDFNFDRDGMNKPHAPVITSDEMMEMGTKTAGGLKIESDLAMRSGNTDHAIEILKRSVEINPNDPDTRVEYAQALEKKLFSRKKNRDPKVYKMAVKQWLWIARKSEFEDEKQKAVTHLVTLCGKVPGQYETQKHFLSRVLVSEEPKSPDSGNGKSDAAEKKVADKKDGEIQ
jgi:hypothetical protein